MSWPGFGKELSTQPVALRGVLSTPSWRAFLVECARALDMHPIADPAVWEYPMDSKGGVGTTIVQPITESFLAIDTWSDHQGAYLIVASCRRFEMSALAPVFEKFCLGIVDLGPHARLRLE